MGAPLSESRYQHFSELFLRALALIYLAAIASFYVQIDGLIGSDGILPAEAFLQRAGEHLGANAYWYLPNLFWWGESNTVIKIVALLAMVASVAVFSGYLPAAARSVALFFLWFAYLSFCNIGQAFFSFQWDILLVETGFLAALLSAGSFFAGKEHWLVFLLRFLLFRLMFSAGIVKLLSGDEAWHSLTALEYHFFTQPLPNPVSWLAHHLPAWLQMVSTAIMFFVELVVPFFVFGPRLARYFAFVSFVALQVMIAFTGNYTFFSYLTIVLSLCLLDDDDLRRFLPLRWVHKVTPRPRAGARGWRRQLAGAFIALIALVGLLQQLLTANLLQHNGLAGDTVRLLSPLRLANRYGLFAVMTKTRPEIIIEGSLDGEKWQAYEFRYKPGALNRHPPQIAPHQPRLDWQMWFAALGDARRNQWLVNFMFRLLQGRAEALDLIADNPFVGAAPNYIRAQLYEYEFTTPAEREQTGNWWKRQFVRAYLPPLTLRGFVQEAPAEN